MGRRPRPDGSHPAAVRHQTGQFEGVVVAAAETDREHFRGVEGDNVGGALAVAVNVHPQKRRNDLHDGRGAELFRLRGVADLKLHAPLESTHVGGIFQEDLQRKNLPVSLTSFNH